MSTSEAERGRVKGHTMRCISPESVDPRLRLVSGWGYRKRRSAPLHGPWGSWSTLPFISNRCN